MHIDTRTSPPSSKPSQTTISNPSPSPPPPHQNGLTSHSSRTPSLNHPPSPSSPQPSLFSRLFYQPFFTPSQLHSLETYKNTGSDLSLTYRYLMTPLYSRLLPYIPPTLAPNTLTVLGLLSVLLPHLLLLYYSYDLQQPAPRLIYYLNAIGLFMYMCFDNLDGKQARRTGSSSPLGHLFDHGCDALTVTIVGLTMVATMGVRRDEKGGGGGVPNEVLCYWLVWTLGQFVCYMATLEEFFTGSMILRQINGPNEGLLLITVFFAMTGWYGGMMWEKKVGLWVPEMLGEWGKSVFGWGFRQGKVWFKAKHWICLFPFPLVLPTSFLNLYEVWKNGHRQKNRSGWKDLATAASYSWNFVVLSVAVFSWLIVTPNSFRAKTMLLIWLSGACFFHVVSRLILAHLTGVKFPLFLKMLMPLCIGAANAVMGKLLIGRPFVDDQVMFWCVYTVTMLFNCWRIYCMITQVCRYLGIRCFSIKKPNEE